MRQLIWRTLRRAARHTELWNGNQERWANFLTADPQRSVIAWSWTQHHKVRAQYSSAQADPAHAHLAFARLRSAREIAAFIRRVTDQDI